jgi:hypothetical protein
MIHYDDALLVAVFPRYASFRFALSEAMRMREPVSGLEVPRRIRVGVSPSQIDAPDISRVIVERDGKVIAPVVNRLVPTQMTTRMGVKAVLHAGDVEYNCSTVAPGAQVTVIAIPRSGDNIEKTFTQRELAAITVCLSNHNSRL